MNIFLTQTIDIIKHPNNHCTAEKLWDLDKQKLDWLKNRGYDVLVIWEFDYMKNKQQTIEKCIKFIKENYERTQS